MRASIFLCLVAFVLLSGLCAAAEDHPAPPWLEQFGKPADGKQIIDPQNILAFEGEVHRGQTCYRILTLQYSGANEILPLFTPSACVKPGTDWGMRPFLPHGVFVSRAGDHMLLVTAGSEEDLDQVEQLVKLLDVPTPRALLEVMLVETTKDVPLPAVNPDGTPQSQYGNFIIQRPTAMFEVLSPFLREPDTIVYRTFLDVPNDQQGVLDLSAYPLPVKGILFGRIRIHPDNTVSLPVIPLYKGDPVEQELFESIFMDHSVLLLNAELHALKPVEDPPGKGHYFYLLVGVNVCRDGSVYLADGMRPLRVLYDGRKKPLIITLQHAGVETVLPHDAWLEDIVTPPRSWPQQNVPPFAASPSMNALLVSGDERQQAVLLKLMPSIDFPQPKLQVEGQFYRISEKDLRELGLRQTRNGDWPLPYSDTGLSRQIALSLVNSKAKVITMPRVIVQPFGAGSVDEYGWGMQVDQAYSRQDGTISVQVRPVFPRPAVSEEKDTKFETLELHADQPVITGVYQLGAADANDLLLFVVKTMPLKGDEPSGMQYLPPLF